jgi:hypothetical protein
MPNPIKPATHAKPYPNPLLNAPPLFRGILATDLGKPDCVAEHVAAHPYPVGQHPPPTFAPQVNQPVGHTTDPVCCAASLFVVVVVVLVKPATLTDPLDVDASVPWLIVVTPTPVSTMIVTTLFVTIVADTGEGQCVESQFCPTWQQPPR